MTIVDLGSTPPPSDWGVEIDHAAIDVLADRWATDVFELPAFDYPGTPTQRDESWWFDYVALSVSVLACLWPPEGEDMWHVECDGDWLDDAPAVFAAHNQLVSGDGIDLSAIASMSDADGQAIFAGRGTLQLIPERVHALRRVATTILERWDGSTCNLVEHAGRDGRQIADLLTTTMPGYLDRPSTSQGVLPFDKLSHLGAAIMAAGVGWSAAGFHGYDDFPVYPDYMLPRVFRHEGIMVYSSELAARIDARGLIEADSPHEHGLRWATVYCGQQLRSALIERGNPVTAPALDYRLWSEAVLGPDAASFGEHHRTITLAY